MFSQNFYVIIEHGISVSGHGRVVLDGINAIYKRFIFQLMSTVQLTGGYAHWNPYIRCYFGQIILDTSVYCVT